MGIHLSVFCRLMKPNHRCKLTALSGAGETMSRVLIECEVLAGVNVSCRRGDGCGSICQVAPSATKKQYRNLPPAYQDTISRIKP